MSIYTMILARESEIREMLEGWIDDVNGGSLSETKKLKKLNDKEHYAYSKGLIDAWKAVIDSFKQEGLKTK